MAESSSTSLSDKGIGADVSNKSERSAEKSVSTGQEGGDKMALNIGNSICSSLKEITGTSLKGEVKEEVDSLKKLSDEIQEDMKRVRVEFEDLMNAHDALLERLKTTIETHSERISRLESITDLNTIDKFNSVFSKMNAHDALLERLKTTTETHSEQISKVLQERNDLLRNLTQQGEKIEKILQELQTINMNRQRMDEDMHKQMEEFNKRTSYLENFIKENKSYSLTKAIIASIPIVSSVGVGGAYFLAKRKSN